MPLLLMESPLCSSLMASHSDYYFILGFIFGKPYVTSRMALSNPELTKESRRAIMYFVYILRTDDNRYYVGISANLNQRLRDHSYNKGAEFTKLHPGATLTYSESHPTLSSARKREVQLKKWSREKKEALLSGNINKLKALSKRRLS
jgi:putative endonuclease